MKLCLNCMEIFESEYDVCPYCGYSGEERNSQLLSLGSQLGNRYIIGSVLSQEAESVTYLAWDRTLNMKVDIVEYRPEMIDAAGMRSFVNRAAALAQFNDNPNFITVYSIIKDKGTAYIIKEHLEGQTLREYTSAFSGKRSRKKATAILRKLIAILQQLNEAGFDHNGVNLDNIIVDEKGEPKLTVIGTATEDELITPEWLQELARKGLKIRKRNDLNNPEMLLKKMKAKEERFSVLFILMIILIGFVSFIGIRNEVWGRTGGEVLSYCKTEYPGEKIVVVAEVKNLTTKKPISYITMGEECYKYEDDNGVTKSIETLMLPCYIPPGEEGLAVSINYLDSVDSITIQEPFTYDLEYTVTIRDRYTGYVNPEVKAEGGSVVLYNENKFKIPDGKIVSINRDEKGKLISCDAAELYHENCSNELNPGRNVCDVYLKFDGNSELIFIPDYDTLTKKKFMLDATSW